MTKRLLLLFNIEYLSCSTTIMRWLKLLLQRQFKRIHTRRERETDKLWNEMKSDHELAWNSDGIAPMVCEWSRFCAVCLCYLDQIFGRKWFFPIRICGFKVIYLNGGILRKLMVSANNNWADSVNCMLFNVSYCFTFPLNAFHLRLKSSSLYVSVCIFIALLL